MIDPIVDGLPFTFNEKKNADGLTILHGAFPEDFTQVAINKTIATQLLEKLQKSSTKYNNISDLIGVSFATKYSTAFGDAYAVTANKTISCIIEDLHFYSYENFLMGNNVLRVREKRHALLYKEGFAHSLPKPWTLDKVEPNNVVFVEIYNSGKGLTNIIKEISQIESIWGFCAYISNSKGVIKNYRVDGIIKDVKEKAIINIVLSLISMPVIVLSSVYVTTVVVKEKNRNERKDEKV